MSKRITILTLALLVALAGSAMAETEATASPRLTLVDPVKDFGTVAKGEKLTWSFTIKNTGTADLEILAARPACGCTVAEFDKVIKPGQTGKVVSVVDTASFNGPIAKSVALETNDPNAPVAQVTISADVKPYVDAHPAAFVRYNMLQGEVEAQTVTLFSEESEPFEIVRVDTPHEWIKVDYKKVDVPLPGVGRKGQDQYRFVFTVGGPDARIGAVAERVRIVTNSKHQPEFFVNVTGVIRPTVRIEPTALNFGEVAPAGENATRSVFLKSLNLKTPENFVVTRAESSLPGVKTAVKPTGIKGEYEVTLEVAKDAKTGNFKGDVKIYTNDSIYSVVTIPVTGTVKVATSASR
ncbi:MAG TPA: DUF1573 domain-containing protein [Thermoanaerobaculia bacterium]|nr:DUF1573 domain-containing protein [Thermoanaerobaculia bacterium]